MEVVTKLENSIARSHYEKVIAIGYGNTLRSDDGAGQKVAEIVDNWNLPQVRAIATHQLTPECAASIAESELAIFVDVYPVAEQPGMAEENAIRVIHIHPSTYRHCSTNEGFGHTTDPHSLLCLAEVVYGHAPPAWWILIPALNFEFGDRLSPLTTEGIDQALQKITEILGAAPP
ncbi:hydrogenase maturation protease [Pseudanabaena sp. PCC 6802]|uniref:hydrogenase maturation protease n=1 Tax=Pseudanabaena sp. PCC 6802 TaxID=118173 RepID=UPI000347A14A|nr:hydrogenase maturation protease [Pseudanabaena sp. PCC 6802]